MKLSEDEWSTLRTRLLAQFPRWEDEVQTALLDLHRRKTPITLEPIFWLRMRVHARIVNRIKKQDRMRDMQRDLEALGIALDNRTPGSGQRRRNKRWYEKHKKKETT